MTQIQNKTHKERIASLNQDLEEKLSNAEMMKKRLISQCNELKLVQLSHEIGIMSELLFDACTITATIGDIQNVQLKQNGKKK